MHTPVEVFLDRAEMEIFENARNTALAFLECKKAKLDKTLPYHLEQRTARWKLADQLIHPGARACAELVNEIVRSTLAEICSQGMPSGRVYEYYALWCVDLMRRTSQIAKTQQSALGYGRLCDPDCEQVVSLKKNVLEQARERWRSSHPEEKIQAELNRRIIDVIGPENILWLLEAAICGVRLRPREDFADWIAEAPDDQASLVSTCVALDKKRSECLQATLRTEEKLEKAWLRFIGPTVQFAKDQIKARKGNLALTLLFLVTVKLTRQYQPRRINKDIGKLSPYVSYEARMIFQIMFQLAPLDWRWFANGVVAMIEAPRAFPRWQCPPEHHAIKSKLRYLAELAVGPVKFPVERAHLLDRLRDPAVTQEEIISLTAEYLELLYDNTEPSERLNELMDGLTSKWSDELAGWLGNVHPKELRHRLRTTSEVEFEKLMAEETAEAKKLEQEMARWRDSWKEYESEAAEETYDHSDTNTANVPLLRLTYVENLGADFWRTHDLTCPRYELGEMLDRYLTEKAVETVVPTDSIARAVDHCIFEMTPEQRGQLPMERIANEPWRKLKRGGQRIYLLEKEGVYFLHLMKRKDWVTPTAQEARY